MIPRDPFMLLSYINTQLRDNYESLDDLCASLDIDQAEVVEKLQGVGYSYDSSSNRFIGG